MSFKRDGDDSCQLNVLKKRRVADLLASYIPEDEALLLKNGRYACTVCYHRPVFDTLGMLSVHRNGKKHVTSLQRFYGKKTEHENEIQKRRHQERVRAEEAGEQAPPAPLLAQTRRITQRALLKQAPYNSCCARNRSGASGGRASSSGSRPSSATSVSLTQSGHPGHPHSESSALHTTSEQSLPGHSGSSPDVGEQKSSKGKERVRRKKGEELSGRAENSTTDPDTERALQHYLRLKSSGWIPDGSGKWVKDQNVEFDSDEEEPPTLPSS